MSVADHLHNLDAQSGHDAAQWRQWIAAALPASLPPAGPELLVCLDIDGTLLQHDGTASHAVRQALAAHQRAGTRVVLATGRGPVGTRIAAEEVGHTQCWAVTSNGAVTARLTGDKQAASDRGFVVFSEELFSPAVALQQLRTCLPEAIFGAQSSQCGMLVSAPWPAGEMQEPTVVVPFSRLCEEMVSRVVVRAPEMAVAEFTQRVHQLGLEAVTYAIGWESWLDVAPPGVTKASGCEALRTRLGIDRLATVVIGDGANDLDMFAWAQWAVAMGQASAHVQRAADFVTAPVREDGAALILQALLAR